MRQRCRRCIHIAGKSAKRLGPDEILGFAGVRVNGPIHFRGQRASSNGANPHHTQALFFGDANHLSWCRRLGSDRHTAWGVEHIGNALNQPRTRHPFDGRQVGHLGTRRRNAKSPDFPCGNQRLEHGNDDISVGRIFHSNMG